MSDADLLHAFDNTGANTPFAQLVTRHLGFVYASALRQTLTRARRRHRPVRSEARRLEFAKATSKGKEKTVSTEPPRPPSKTPGLQPQQTPRHAG